jgi:hypothetical protein
VQPVKGWIEEYAADLRLRDEVEREAMEWRRASEALANATPSAHEAGGVGRLENSRKTVDAAIAARRGPRLEAAQKLLSNPVFADQMHDDVRDYLHECNIRETEDRNRQRRVIGRAFVKPALQALEDGRADHALHLAAAGALLAQDFDFALVKE